MANRLIEVTNGLNILVNYGTEIEVERNSTSVKSVHRTTAARRPLPSGMGRSAAFPPLVKCVSI